MNIEKLLLDCIKYKYQATLHRSSYDVINISNI